MSATKTPEAAPVAAQEEPTPAPAVRFLDELEPCDAPFRAQLKKSDRRRFYYCAAKAFYRSLRVVAASDLVAAPQLVLKAYRTAFFSRSSLAQLAKQVEVSVEALPGDPWVEILFLFTAAGGLAIGCAHGSISVEQGAFRVNVRFDASANPIEFTAEDPEADAEAAAEAAEAAALAADGDAEGDDEGDDEDHDNDDE